MYNQGKIMRRLLGRPSADSPSSTANDAALGVTSSPTAPLSYRPYASQTAVYPTGDPISSIDRSPDGRLALLGGRHILQTVHLDGLQFKKGVDVRAAIGGQPSGKASAAASVADQYSIKDAKLSIPSTGGEPTIFTACANGKIFMYDIGRLGSGTGPDFIQAREDSRQVNKLDFNPHRGNWLLAGGQDGVVRCFDVKSPVSGRAGPTFRTFQSFRCNAEGIRDVKWSPKDGMIFACATESGFLLKWDIRKSNMPLLKINAHDTQMGVTSISWHPDGDHLITAGLDSKCHVWDLSKNAEKRQKPKWTISTPAPVAAVSWRPALWSATAQGKRAAQVAVSYDEGGNTKRHGINSVHIWDLARPSMPFKEINIFDRCPSSLLWHDQDLLWTVGQDGLFAQCDVAFAPKVLDRQPLSNLNFSSKGEVLMLLEERTRPTRPRPPVIPQEKGPTSSYSSSPTGPMLSISRSDSEEDVMASFLAPKRRGQHRRKPTSSRPISTQPMSTTPPSGSNLDENPISLDQVIKLTGIFKPQQVMAIGHVPAAFKGDVYEFMASQYLEILQNDLPVTQGGPPLNVRITKILEQYARAAEAMSQFRLAQTWRILSYAMSLLLTRRSQYHLEVRTTGNSKKKSYSPSSDHRSDRRNLSLRPDGSLVRDNSSEAATRKTSVVSTDSRLSTTNKSLLAEELDSESNVATPLARPMVEGDAHNDHTGARKLTPVMEMESFKLPPAMQEPTSSPRKRLDSTPHSVVSEESQLSSIDGYDFYDVDTVRHDLPEAIDVPKKKEPLSLDYVDPKSSNPRRRPINRHDSDESFGQMFSVSNGSRQASMLASSSGGSNHQLRQMAQDTPSSQEAYEADYGSRIRGHKIGDSPDRTFKRPALRPKKEGSGSSREDYMVSQTTIDTLDTSDASFPVRSLRPSSPPSTRRVSDDRVGMDRPEDHQSPSITETDFLPWTDDPPYPYPLLSDPSRLSSKHAPPIDPYDLIQRALSHESRHSALHASAIILLLKPLVPETVIDGYQATSILRSHHNRLMRMKCFVEAAMLRNLCVQDWPDGLDMWGENYTAVFLPAQEKVSATYTCSTCHKAREVDKSQGKDGLNGNGIWKCERCKAAMAPCAVCGHRGVTAGLSAKITVAEGLQGLVQKNTERNGGNYDGSKHGESGGGQGQELGVEAEVDEGDETGLSTWWYCPGCAHGGHASCLMQWHAITDPASESATQLAHEVRSLMLQSSHHHHAAHASHGGGGGHHGHGHSYSTGGNYGHQHYTRSSGEFGGMGMMGSRPGSRPASRPSSRPNSRPASPVLSFEDGDRLHPEMFSDGCCPVDGCGHACLPGRWRNESLSARTEELGRVVREQTRSTIPGAGGSGGMAGMAMPGFNKSSDGVVMGGERRVSGSGGGDSILGARPASLGSATMTDGTGGLGSGTAGDNMRNNVYRVRGDTVDYVPQSRAVESVRETLNRPGGGGGGSGHGGGMGIGGSGGSGGGNLGASNMGTGAMLSSSPSGIVGGVLRNSSSSISAGSVGLGGSAGSGTGERERRKSVKFAGAAARGAVNESIRGQGGQLAGHQEEEAIDVDGSPA